MKVLVISAVKKISIGMLVLFGVSNLTLGQTLTSDQPGNEIVFSALDATKDATEAVSAIGDTTTAVQYGPWGCKFTLQPLNFECGKDEIIPPPPDITTEQEVILEFLKNKREELNTREKVLTRKEQELADLEKRVEQKIDEVRQLNNKIEAERKKATALDTENLRKLVSYYEKIPAENAAIFFNALDPQTATMILTRMSARKAAAILTELNPQKTAELTESIAKIKTNREAYLGLPNYDN